MPEILYNHPVNPEFLENQANQGNEGNQVNEANPEDHAIEAELHHPA